MATLLAPVSFREKKSSPYWFTTYVFQCISTGGSCLYSLSAGQRRLAAHLLCPIQIVQYGASYKAMKIAWKNKLVCRVHLIIYAKRLSSTQANVINLTIITREHPARLHRPTKSNRKVQPVLQDTKSAQKGPILDCFTTYKNRWPQKGEVDISFFFSSRLMLKFNSLYLQLSKVWHLHRIDDVSFED